MTLSIDAPSWRRQAERLRKMARESSDPKLRDQFARIASDWIERTNRTATAKAA